MGRRTRLLLGASGLLLAAALLGFVLPVMAARLQPGPLAAPPGPAEVAGFSGSAFAVAPGMLVTNAHVALRCEAEGLAIQVAGRRGPWRIALLDAAADLALLGGPADAGEGLPVSPRTHLPRGLPVMAMGYPARPGSGAPAGTLYSATGQVLRAALTVHRPEGERAASFIMTDRQGREVEPTWEDGLHYFGADQADRLRWLIEIDAPITGGGSGGPVLDAGGSVVGVVYAGDGRRGATAMVPLADLRGFLGRAGITPSFRAAPAGSPADWRAVEGAAAPGVWRVLC